MKWWTIGLIGLNWGASVAAQEEGFLYRIYETRTGKEINVHTLIDSLMHYDIIFFGEEHDNPICHWLQLQVVRGIYRRDSAVDVGMEMFEADVQPVIDEYMDGLFGEFYFEKEIKRWKNYTRAYKPIVQWIYDTEHTRLIATNVPRRYAGAVAKHGIRILDSLPSWAYAYLAPLPISYDTTQPCYAEMLNGDMGHAMGIEIVEAQVLKDATMAYFIAKNKIPDRRFVHLNGDFHSRKHCGIPHYLQAHLPQARIAVISTVTSESSTFLPEYAAYGDYILLINEEFYPSD